MGDVDLFNAKYGSFVFGEQSTKFVSGELNIDLNINLSVTMDIFLLQWEKGEIRCSDDWMKEEIVYGSGGDGKCPG